MRKRAASAVVLAAALLTACGEAPTGRDGQVVDVAPAPDAAVDPANDPRAAHPVEGGFAGVLPGDFPDGLPVPEPASLTDFASTPAGDSVVLLSPLPPDQLLPAYLATVGAAGWAVETTDGGARLSRGTVNATVTVIPSGPGSEVRFTYPGGGG